MTPHRTLSSFPFKSSLLTVLVSFYLLQFIPSPSPIQTPTQNQNQTRISRNNYIVRFREYKTAEDHCSYLKSRITPDGWKWIERKNPASKYPTDFGLISVEESAKQGLIEEIERLNLVKDVSVDSSYKRGLLGGAFEDGKKRPGKIFTSMSFNEGEHYTATTSNCTINWRRHLLMQVFIFFFFFFGGGGGGGQLISGKKN